MNENLNAAITAIRAGNKTETQQLLKTILQADPNNVQAWLWLTQTGLSAEQSIECLERVLKLDPKNVAAKKELLRLQVGPGKGQKAQPDPQPAPMAETIEQTTEAATEATVAKPEAPATSDVATEVAEAEPKPETPPSPTGKSPMLQRGWVILALSIAGIIVILCAVAVLVIVSPMLGQSAAVAAPTKTPTGAPSLPHPAPETIIFEGSGDVVESFEVSGVDAILVGGFHLDERTFAVTVKDSSGTVLGIPVHCIGGCTAEGIVRLRGDGVYYLEILAYDEWEVDITPLGD